MKKLSIALSLILCLVLCVFVFASCGKKDNATGTTAAQGTTPEGTAAASTTAPATTAEATTAEPTTAPHEHTPEADYTIDKPATCGADGSKSIHCSECGNIIPGTEVKIDADPTLHVVDEWTTVPATVIKEGKKTGTCTVCGQPVEKTVEFEAKIYDAASAGYAWKIKKNLNDALAEGEHFYPTEENPNGLAYYFEVDFLWNETITTNWIDGDGMRIELVDADSTRDNLYLLVPKNDKWGSSDAKASGGFDYGWNANHKIVYGPKGVDGTGTNAENFPNIGAYGWHRIGVKVYQEAAIKGDGVTYSMVSTLYLDGIKAWQITFDEENGKSFSKWLEKKLMFFTATNDNGTLVYADPSADLCLDFSAYHSEEMTGLFMVTGEAVSCAVDPDFTPEGAAPVATPAAATITVAEGVDLPAEIWFADPDAVPEPDIDFEVFTYNPADLDHYTYNNDKSMLLLTKTLPDMLNGEHFYPTEENPEGLDAYFEMAILYNETMANFANDAFLFTFNFKGGNGDNLFYLYTKDNASSAWCKFSGGFDYGRGKGDNPILFGPAGTQGGTKDTYPNLGEYGWHKIGVRMHQSAALDGDNVVYSGVSYLYIDGELVWKVDLNMEQFVTHKNLLFTATNNAGVLVYADNANADKVRMQLRGEGINNSSAPFYFIFGDVSWSVVDPDWIPAVEPVADPTPAEYKINDDLTVPAAVYFQAKSN